MSSMFNPLTPEENACYASLTQENLDFLLNRYNRVNRWVIADMIRRSCYHSPDKKALIYNDRSLTYAQLEAESNRVANALIDLGIQKYDRVAILAHNTIHHVLTWLGCCKIGAVYLAINYLLKGKDIFLLHQPLREQALHHRGCPVRSDQRCVRGSAHRRDADLVGRHGRSKTP